MSGYSHGFLNNITNIFQIVFPDSAIAKCFEVPRTKETRLANHGSERYYNLSLCQK